MAAVYYMRYKLFPQFLLKKRYVLFVASLIAAVIIALALEITLQGVFYYIRKGHFYLWIDFLIRILSGLTDIVQVVSFFFVIYAVDFFQQAEKNRIRAEKEKLEVELELLKIQMNPHFLFNAINSIHVLMQKDRELAESVLLRFADLLRYQLYDHTSHYISVERELTFLRDYIELERLRVDDKTHISYVLPEVDAPLRIAPFILITFVENAFKHRGFDDQFSSFVKVRCDINDNALTLVVSNSYKESVMKKDKTTSGLGSPNVSRRLDLLYPERYTLKVTTVDSVYEVELCILLSND